MSTTIATNKLHFFIFGAGHDYTLADSGDGEVQVFSHPFVPLNSLNYAGQWYFIVPDENGNPIDAVKDDVAHCTFTPALGDAFATLGETVVECNYHREYIHDEETIIVDKTVRQKITVVDHGTVASSNTYCDLYTDGYGFYRPQYTGTVEADIRYTGEGSPTKVSSIPWRAKYLGSYPFYPFITGTNLTDITELQYADVSGVKEIYGLIQYGADGLDLTPIAAWDVSNVEEMISLLEYTGITNLLPLAAWNTSKVQNLNRAFAGIKATTAHGLESWVLSSLVYANGIFDSSKLQNTDALAGWRLPNVDEMENAFANCEDLVSIAGLASWNPSSVRYLRGMLYNTAITSLSPLGSWNIKPRDLRETFQGTKITTLVGLEGFDLSEISQPLYYTFGENYFLENLNGIEGWDVSAVESFERMCYGCPWLSDISAIAGWVFSSGEKYQGMFGHGANLLTLAGLVLELSAATNMGGMFGRFPMYYSHMIDRRVYGDAYYYWDAEGNRYTYSQVTSADDPYTELYADASAASSWTVIGTGWDAFDNAEWINVPAWN